MRYVLLETFIFLMYTVTISTCQQQQILNYIGNKLDIKVTIVDNLENNGEKHKFRIAFRNTGRHPIRTGDWAIYFYSFFMIEPDHLPSKISYVLKRYNVKLSHVKGSLFRIEPTMAFRLINPSFSLFIEFYGQYWAVSKTDVPPNWYVAQDGLIPVLIKSTALGKDFVTDITSKKAWKRYKNDQYNPFMAPERFRRYGIRDLGYAPKSVIPTPKRIEFYPGSGFVDISTLQIISSLEVEQEAKYLGEKLGKPYKILRGFRERSNSIILDVKTNIGTNREMYILKIHTSNKTVVISGQSPAGVFYGVQSLLSLQEGANYGLLSNMHIQDEPRFDFRGMHVDVARNFRTKADLIRLMDAMAMYKLNKFHIHLSDDEGWRLEIPGIPELTEVVIGHATHLFFDHPHEPDPEERGLYWATRFTDTKKVFHFLPDRIYENIDTKRSGEIITKQEVCGENKENCPALTKPQNIIGIQDQGWSETVFTSDNFDYMLVPRLIALAERAWHKASWKDLDKPERDKVALDDWEAIANTLGYKELRRLDDMEIHYRVPLPGAKTVGIQKHVKANVEFPGLTIEYSDDKGKTWKDVRKGITLEKKLLFRSRSANGSKWSRMVQLDTRKKDGLLNLDHLDTTKQRTLVVLAIAAVMLLVTAFRLLKT